MTWPSVADLPGVHARHLPEEMSQSASRMRPLVMFEVAFRVEEARHPLEVSSVVREGAQPVASEGSHTIMGAPARPRRPVSLG